jgi:hypothetical protein
MNPRQPLDVWCFTGAKALNNTLDNAAAVDAGIDPVTNQPIVTIPATAHGFLASSGDLNSLIFLAGTTNYNGLRKIYAVATNTITIYADYVAETFGGTETIRCAIQPDYPYEYHGIEVTLNAVGGEATGLTLTKDSALSSAFDHRFHNTSDMTSVQYIDDRENPPKVCEKNDLLILGWANGQSKTFGAKIFTRRLM